MHAHAILSFEVCGERTLQQPWTLFDVHELVHELETNTYVNYYNAEYVKRVVCLSWWAQDEAAELTGGPEEGSAEKGLALLAAHCNVAAVTLGERGCLVQQRGGVAFSEPAASNVKVVDATGVSPTHCLSWLLR